MTLENGFRSKCCYAMVRVGTRKARSGQKVLIWICNNCKKRDVDIVEYIKGGPIPSNLFENRSTKFAQEPEPPDPDIS